MRSCNAGAREDLCLLQMGKADCRVSMKALPQDIHVVDQNCMDSFTNHTCIAHEHSYTVRAPPPSYINHQMWENYVQSGIKSTWMLTHATVWLTFWLSVAYFVKVILAGVTLTKRATTGNGSIQKLLTTWQILQVNGICVLVWVAGLFRLGKYVQTLQTSNASIYLMRHL